MTGSFGRIFPFIKVEQYILDLAEKWFLEYLADVEREMGRPARYFAPLKDWGAATEFDKWPEEHLPFLLVMYTGLNDRPTRKGDGKWDAKALFAASIITSSTSKPRTRENMHVYGAAFKAMLLQHRSLEHPDDIGGVTWADERPAPLPREQERTLGAINMYFYVDVKDVVDERGTPPEAEPREDPYEEAGTFPPITQAGPAEITLQEIT